MVYVKCHEFTRVFVGSCACDLDIVIGFLVFGVTVKEYVENQKMEYQDMKENEKRERQRIKQMEANPQMRGKKMTPIATSAMTHWPVSSRPATG